MAATGKQVLYAHCHSIFGNTCDKMAVFAMQLFGLDVSNIVTVQLSNTIAEKEESEILRINSNAGPDESALIVVAKLLKDDLDKVYRSLKRADIKYDFVLSAFLADGLEGAAKWSEIIKDIKTNHPDTIYMCDPILGDNGVKYTQPGLEKIFIEDILPQADLASPNGYELGWLLGRDIKTEQDAFDGIYAIHDLGVKVVFVTSVSTENKGMLSSYASIRDDGNMCYKIEFRERPVRFVGPGDLTMSLFGSWYMETDGDVKVSFERAISTMNQIIERTYKHAVDVTPEGTKIAQRDLNLRVLDDIPGLKNPEVTLPAQRIPMKRS